MVPVCLDCAPAYALEKAKKKRKAKQVEKKRATKLNDRAYLVKRAQFYCNKWVRLRDEGKSCVSCGTTDAKFHAGHYRPTSSSPEHRFNEYNLAAQCPQCNLFKSGNLTEYRKELINRIGLQHVEHLESKTPTQKLDCADLLEIIEYYKGKIKAKENPLDHKGKAG